VPHGEEKLRDDVVLHHTHAIKVLPHGRRKLLPRLPLLSFPALHCRGVLAHAASLVEDVVVVRVAERPGRREPVFASVLVEDTSIDGAPLNLREEMSAPLSVSEQVGNATPGHLQSPGFGLLPRRSSLRRSLRMLRRGHCSPGSPAVVPCHWTAGRLRRGSCPYPSRPTWGRRVRFATLRAALRCWKL